MKIGQMSFPKLSVKADYLQLDICGLNKEEALEKYIKYNKKIPIILHGDWDKRKGVTENNLKERHLEYIEIINMFKSITSVYGITIHPPKRKTMDINELLYICTIIKKETGVLVFIENRSNKSINVSTPEEIIEVSNLHFMTIDIPQLYISCKYDKELLLDTLKKINHSNVLEYHFANIQKKEKNTFVARKINDGDLNLQEIFKLLNKKSCYTFEILGGINVFEANKEIIMSF